MGWHRQMQQAPVSLGSKQDEDTHDQKMIKLGQVDLAADNAWAPFGGRLLKPPNALPPPPSASTSCPLSKRSRDELCDSQEDPAGGAASSAASSASGGVGGSSGSGRVTAARLLVDKQKRIQELTTDENKLTDRGRQLKKLINKKSHQDFSCALFDLG